jgi:hypothetical protein
MVDVLVILFRNIQLALMTSTMSAFICTKEKHPKEESMGKHRGVKWILGIVTMSPIIIILMLRNYSFLLGLFNEWETILYTSWNCYQTEICPIDNYLELPLTKIMYWSIIGFLALINFIFMIPFKAYSIRKPELCQTITSVANKAGDTWKFFLETMGPLTILPMNNLGMFVLLLLYYGLFALMIVRMPKLYENPILAVWGFRLYQVTTDKCGDNPITVLSYDCLEPGMMVIPLKLDYTTYFLFEYKEKEKKGGSKKK